MIYEAEKGQTLHEAAAEAHRLGCARVIHNDILYRISLEIRAIGRVEIRGEQPVEVSPV